ncbi:hypothetical protein QR680_002546 [Steinernema hermaphroditum]|uniref:Uncharacterized protein n=1 Tax=Steinernema hermaphroditum TaxID=289476 RepID=A0AA39H347_9BILA|nr:hypothetical protein QR680_002546 [Steinernema hermaphroditum]
MVTLFDLVANVCANAGLPAQTDPYLLGGGPTVVARFDQKDDFELNRIEGRVCVITNLLCDAYEHTCTYVCRMCAAAKRCCSVTSCLRSALYVLLLAMFDDSSLLVLRATGGGQNDDDDYETVGDEEE